MSPCLCSTAMTSDACAQKEYPLDCQVVYKQWRMRKISTDVAIHDITFGRDGRSSAFLRAVRESVLAETALSLEQQQLAVQTQLLGGAKPFIESPVVDEWLQNFKASPGGGVKGRWKPLLFIGASASGKSWKALSIFGTATLKVSCNGLGRGMMPNLKEFDRTKHKAIFFDEIRPDIILCNRELFQSGPFKQKLGVSACGQHEYAVWVYGVALIMAANAFAVDEKSPDLAADQDWLQTNIVTVDVPPGGKWWVDEPVPHALNASTTSLRALMDDAADCFRH